MGKYGDIKPGKTGPVSGWKKSGAHTMKEAVPKSRCMSAERGNAMGSHKRLSTEHGTGARGKHHELRSADKALGAKTRTFKSGIPSVAPAPVSGSGSKKSRELGK